MLGEIRDGSTNEYLGIIVYDIDHFIVFKPAFGIKLTAAQLAEIAKKLSEENSHANDDKRDRRRR